jgi:hypothetical protein
VTNASGWTISYVALGVALPFTAQTVASLAWSGRPFGTGFELVDAAASRLAFSALLALPFVISALIARASLSAQVVWLTSIKHRAMIGGIALAVLGGGIAVLANPVAGVSWLAVAAFGLAVAVGAAFTSCWIVNPRYARSSGGSESTLPDVRAEFAALGAPIALTAFTQVFDSVRGSLLSIVALPYVAVGVVVTYALVRLLTRRPAVRSPQ